MDKTITNFLTYLLPHNQFTNLFFSFFSQKGESILIWAVLLLLLIIFEEMRNKKFIVYFLVSFAVTGILVNIVIKNVVKRPRPTTHISAVNSCPKDYSFPSGHSAAAFSSAVVFAYFDKKRKYFYYAVAILIAYSRIFLGCHYFFDVVVGGLIGSLISALLVGYHPHTLFQRYLHASPKAS